VILHAYELYIFLKNSIDISLFIIAYACQNYLYIYILYMEMSRTCYQYDIDYNIGEINFIMPNKNEIIAYIKSIQIINFFDK